MEWTAARDEVTAGADREWTAQVDETAARLVLMQVDSWMTYAGGAPKYRQKCNEVVAQGYEGFTLA